MEDVWNYCKLFEDNKLSIPNFDPLDKEWVEIIALHFVENCERLGLNPGEKARESKEFFQFFSFIPGYEIIFTKK